MGKQTNVVNLSIYEDIPWVDPDLLARAVVQVEQVDIMCKISRSHIRVVMCQLDNNSRLRRLSLGRNDVSKIPGKVLENAIEILRKNGGTVIVTQSRRI